MSKKNTQQSILFLQTALEFIPEIWDEEGVKCTQLKIATRLGVTSSYLSKAKENASYAQNLSRKIMTLIKELGGSYSSEQLAFFDKAGNPFNILIDSDNSFPIKLHYGIDPELFKTHITQTKSIRILTSWSGETYSNLIDIIESEPSIWEVFERIHILMLHPNSAGAFLRSKGLGLHAERGFNRIKDDLQEMMNLPPFIRDRVEVRLYDEMPTIKLIMLDDLNIMGFFLLKEITGVGYNFMFNPKLDPTLHGELSRHYDKLWNKSTPFVFETGEEQLESWTHAVYKRHHSQSYSKFEGTFRMYFPEQYPTISTYRNHKVVASIGCNIIKIEQPQKGMFTCTMKSVGFEEDDYYKGELVNVKFNNPDYLILQLRNKYNTRYLNLLISIKNAQKRQQNFGVFSVIYGASGKIGSGKMVLVPVEDKFDDLKPSSIDPAKMEEEHQQWLSQEMLGYLAPKRHSLLNSSSRMDELAEPLTLSGTFHLYASKAGDAATKNHGITVGILEILPTGLVRFKNKKRGFEGSGWAIKRQNNLFIELINNNPNVGRTSLFIIQIGINPSLEKSDSIYSGVSAGTSWVEELPVGSRIILTPCFEGVYDELDPESCALGSSEFLAIPAPIRMALTGTTRNKFGFSGAIQNLATLEQAQLQEEDHGQLFVKAAKLDALEGNTDSCLQNLEKAAYHGANNWKEFGAWLKAQKLTNKKVLEAVSLLEQRSH